MKKQSFYPKQVLKKLVGKDFVSLDSGQQHALKFFVRNSRKFEVAVGVTQTRPVNMDDLKDSSGALSMAILSNVHSKISLMPSASKR